MQDEQPARGLLVGRGYPRAGVQVHNPMLQRVLVAAREIRLLNPGNPVKMAFINAPEDRLSMVEYTLPDNKGGIKFSCNTYALSIQAWPASRFHQKVLPGDLLFHGLIETEGFLDPPMNTIPFRDMLLRAHLYEENTPTIWFPLTEDTHIDAGVRLLLTKFAFSD